MPARVEVNYPPARAILSDCSGRSLMSAYNLPRSVVDHLSNSDVLRKKILLDGPFLSLVAACEREGLGRFINPVEILTDDEVWRITVGNYDEVDYVRLTPNAGGEDEQVSHLGLKSSIDRIKACKEFHDNNSVSMLLDSYDSEIASATSTEKRRDQLIAERKFFSLINPTVIKGQFTWRTNSSALVADNADQLEKIQKALLADSALVNSEHINPTTSLEDLIRLSKEVQELRRTINEDLTYEQFQIFYVPFAVSYSTEIHWVHRSEKQYETDYTERRLKLVNRIPRVHHAMVISPPGKEMALLRSNINSSRIMSIQSDEWGPYPRPEIKVNDKWIDVSEAIDLFEACKSDVVQRSWTDEHA